MIEFASTMGGLMMATVFKWAPISILHRLVSFIEALEFVIAAVSGFWYAMMEEYQNAPGLEWALLLIPFGFAPYKNSKWFISGEEKGKMNVGISELSGRLTGVMAISALVWFFLASVASSLKS